MVFNGLTCIAHDLAHSRKVQSIKSGYLLIAITTGRMIIGVRYKLDVLTHRHSPARPNRFPLFIFLPPLLRGNHGYVDELSFCRYTPILTQLELLVTLNEQAC